jgi:hypothetical protein
MVGDSVWLRNDAYPLRDGNNKTLLFFLRAGHEDRTIGLPVSYSLFLTDSRVVEASSLSEAHGHPMRQKASSINCG